MEIKKSMEVLKQELGQSGFNLLYCLLRDVRDDYVGVIEESATEEDERTSWSLEQIGEAKEALQSLIQHMESIE